MKHRSSIYFLLVLMGFMVWTMYSYVQVGEQVDEYREHKAKLIESLSLENRLLNVNTSLNTFLGTDWIIRKEISEEHRKNADIAREGMMDKAFYHLCAAILFVVVVGALYWNTFSYRQSFTLSITVVAMTFLFFGVTLPFMEIAAFHKDFTLQFKFPWEFPVFGNELSMVFPGEMYYVYQEKSVFGLLNILFLAENYFVFVAILCFSVIIPFVKLFYSLSVLLTPGLQERDGLRRFMAMLSKWSMADVFVASIFLGYLSMQNINPQVQTDSRTMVGVYFFFLFVVFSIISSKMIEWTIRGAVREAPKSVRGQKEFEDSEE